MKIDKTNAEHKRAGTKKKKEALVKNEILDLMQTSILSFDSDVYKKKQF